MTIGHFLSKLSFRAHYTDYAKLAILFKRLARYDDARRLILEDAIALQSLI